MTVSRLGESNSLADRQSSAYVTTFELPRGGKTIADVLQPCQSWIEEAPRNLDVDLRTAQIELRADAAVHVQHHADSERQVAQVRVEERNQKGCWITNFTVALDADSIWMRICVENDQNHNPSVPRLASYLMDEFDIRDGLLGFESKPVTVSAIGVEELIEALSDEARGCPIFVAAASTEIDFGKWCERIDLWMRDTRGLCHVRVLDPMASVAFNESVNSAFAIEPWTIRTFLPNVDFDSDVDSRRHRILGRKRLGNQPDQSIRRMMGQIARAGAAQRETPPAIRRAQRVLRSSADAALLRAANLDLRALRHSHDAPHVSEGPTAQEQQILTVDAIASILDVDTVTEQLLQGLKTQQTDFEHQSAMVQSLTEKVHELGDRLSESRDVERELTDVVDALEREKADLNLDLLIERDEARLAQIAKQKAESRALWLERKLSEAKVYDIYADSPGDLFDRVPGSFEELLTRKTELQDLGLFLTCNEDAALALDDLDQMQDLVNNAWHYLHALADYVRWRLAGNNKSLQQYVHDTPYGYLGISPKKARLGESGKTMRDYGHERNLPVPLEIDSSGSRMMRAHLVLGQRGQWGDDSPRMYILDQVSNHDCVVIGYIGRHMTNTLT